MRMIPGRLSALRLLSLATFLFALTPSSQALSADKLKQIRFDQHIGQQISRDLRFRDSSGKTVTIGDCLDGKPTLLVLGYYHCPMLCTLINDGLIQALQELRFDVGQRFNIINVSIDSREGPAEALSKRKEYLRRYGRDGAAGGWHFLTGDKGAVAQLANESGFHFLFDPDVNEYAHPSGFLVLTPQGKISRYFFGVNFEPHQLRSAILAASAEKRGSIVTQLILLCYHYNPITGKYGALIMNVMRGAALTTVVGMFAGIFWLAGRDRRSRGVAPKPNEPQPASSTGAPYQDG